MAPRSPVLLVVLLLVLAGCSSSSGLKGAADVQESSAVNAVEDGDPSPPEKFPLVQKISQAGGEIVGEHASVIVPRNAWREGTSGTVSMGKPMAPSGDGSAPLVWGAPVRVDHDGALRKALTLTWDVSSLSEVERQSLVLTRWDPRNQAWAFEDVPFRVSGGVLTAKIQRFSVWTWVKSAAVATPQTVGQMLGKRAAAPRCSSTPLPPWVTSVVRPDQNVSGAAVRTCSEGASDPDQVVVRVVNNRSFAQRLSLGPDGAAWLSARQSEEEVSATGAVWIAAHAALASDHTYLIPPTSEVMITLARPPSPESVQFQLSAHADATTVFADLVSFGVDSMKMPDMGSPVAGAYLQAYLQCGGAKLAQSPPATAQAAVATALDTVHQCASTMNDDADGPLAATLQDQFEAVHRREVAKGGLASARAVRNFRAVHQVTDRLGYIKLFEFSDYTSNQLADAIVGPTRFSVTVTGRPPVLGVWKATCADADADSDLLYHNLGRQDEFVHAETELWRLSSWKRSGQKAVRPLSNCSAIHRAAVARNITSTWGVDAKSAQVIANIISSSGGGASLQTDDILEAPVPASCRHEAGRLVDGELPLPIDPDLGYSYEGSASVIGDIPPMLVDLDGDGVDELVGVLSCNAGGVGWPEWVLAYSPGPELVGYVDLGSFYTFEHSEVQSLTPTPDGLRVEWKSYDGCCFNESWYYGYLRKADYVTEGEYGIVDIQEGKL